MHIPHRGISSAFSALLLLLSCRSSMGPQPSRVDTGSAGDLRAVAPDDDAGLVPPKSSDATVEVLGDRMDGRVDAATCGIRGTPACEEVTTDVCGNAVLTAPEVCDDGNTVSGDGCTADCTAVEPGWRCRVPGRSCAPICGDRVLEGSETCDDGNTVKGDGCSSFCLTEPGWDCSGGICLQVPSVDGGHDLGDAFPGCGDGIMSGAEECDLGSLNSDSEYGGCATTCYFGAFCGDGVVNVSEECDLGGNNGQSYGKGGCTLGCTKTHYCGDGNVDPDYGEECDFGDKNGLKLDRTSQQPSDSPDAITFCTLKCQIAPCGCVY